MSELDRAFEQADSAVKAALNLLALVFERDIKASTALERRGVRGVFRNDEIFLFQPDAGATLRIFVNSLGTISVAFGNSDADVSHESEVGNVTHESPAALAEKIFKAIVIFFAK